MTSASAAGPGSASRTKVPWFGVARHSRTMELVWRVYRNPGGGKYGVALWTPLRKRGTLGPDGQRVVSASEAQRFQVGEQGQQRPEGGVHQLRLHFVEKLRAIAAGQLSRFQEGGDLDHIPVARHTDFRSYLDRAFPGDFADELHVLIAVGIKELGGEEPEGAQLAPDGTGDFEDHEAWKWGRGIDGAGKNIASWTGMMKK